MLDALAVIGIEIFVDLRLVVRASLIGMRILPHGLVIACDFEAGELALDVEIADLAEIEEPLVEAGPFLHAAAIDVVGQMVDRA